MGRRSVNQPELFDASKTVPTACPVGACAAIRLPGQHRVPTCAHDLSTEDPRGKRPRHCLNTIDPATTPFPEGF
jgi:hypothetical protein